MNAFSIVFLCVLVGFSQLLQAGVLTGELDKTEGSLNDEFIYTLTIEGQYDALPEFPSVQNLQVQQAETRQSVQIVNGQMTRQFQINYIIRAEQKGAYTIPPIRMLLDGQEQQTLPLSFTVREASGNPRYSGDESFFLDRQLSKAEVYVGEGVIVSDQVVARERLIEADLKRDEFPDSFRQIDIDEEKRYQRIFNGREYDVVEFKKVLIPTKDGSFRLPPAMLEAMVRVANPQQRRPRSRSFFDDFFGRTPVVRKRARSESFDIHVKALPLQGRSSDFSGLVGNFRLDADVSLRTLAPGETATLTVTVRGSGLTDGMAEPKIGFSDALKVYSDKPVSSDRVGLDGIYGERTYKYALVPTVGGQLDLGRLDIQVFNPEIGQYEVIHADLGMLTVTGGEPATQSNDSQMMAADPGAKQKLLEVETLGDDIVGLMPVERLLDRQGLQGRDWWLAGSLSSFGFAFMLAGFLRRYRQQTFEQRQSTLRQRRAYRKFQRASQSAGMTELEALSQLHKAFRTFICERFALTDLTGGHQAILNELSRAGYTHQHERLRSLLAEIDRLSFSGCTVSSEEVSRLRDQLLELAREVAK